MNLIVDIGNSRCKMALCSTEGEMCECSITPNFNEEILDKWSDGYVIEKCILSSSRGEQAEVERRLQEIIGHCLVLSHSVPLPIGNNYSTPSTLGMDRLAAAVGASSLYGKKNMLIIDMGTAITIDFVSEGRGFEGGYISLGLGARFRALSDYTASLPLLSPEDLSFQLPRTTKNAIAQGVMHSVFWEINGQIANFREKYDEILIIFAGGDAKYFENRIKNAIFAKGELVILGLNRILEYNVKK